MTTDFCSPVESLTVVRSSTAAWQCYDRRLAQMRILASFEQLAGVLQSLHLLGIAHQKAREDHQPTNADYRQHGEQGHH